MGNGVVSYRGDSCVSFCFLFVCFCGEGIDWRIVCEIVEISQRAGKFRGDDLGAEWTISSR
jgi:hypothetical protein